MLCLVLVLLALPHATALSLQRPCETTSRARCRQVAASAAAKRKVLYSFTEARNMARSMGLSSREEWDEYSCPGAYQASTLDQSRRAKHHISRLPCARQLPKDPHVVWEAEFVGWDDWLGLPRTYADAAMLVAPLGLQGEADYTAHVSEHPDDRLPARPDLFYREQWVGWEEFLGATR